MNYFHGGLALRLSEVLDGLVTARRGTPRNWTHQASWKGTADVSYPAWQFKTLESKPAGLSKGKLVEYAGKLIVQLLVQQENHRTKLITSND